MTIRQLSQIGIAVLGLTFIFSAFQNCGRAPASRANEPIAYPNAKASNSELTSLFNLVYEIVARDLSCSSDSDCSALAIGAKSCGGPRQFLVASKRNPDIQQAEALALELEQKELAANQSSDSVGTCSVVLPPQVSCVQNYCR